MVLQMKRVLRIAFLFALALLMSCEDRGFFADCSNCSEDEPENATLNIKTSVYPTGIAVVVNIYEGNLEDNILYKTVSSLSGSMTASVSLNKKYTLTAEYFLSPDHYFTVNSVTPRVKYTDDECDNPCYFVYDNDVNLRLRLPKF